MLTVWGRPNSTNVKKVLWCADELGLDYEHIPAGGAFGLVDEPAYRAMNPNGLVPTIRDGDLVLWESNAIVRHLVRSYGAGTPLAMDGAEWAVADSWMDWVSTTLAAPYRDVYWNLVRTKPEDRDEAAVARGLKRSGAVLAIADAALASRPYLGRTSFSMADIPLGCFAWGWFNMSIDRPNLSNLRAWFDRLTVRPAYQKRVMMPLS